MNDRHLFLVGFMGAGKSTVARLVAEALHRRCIDLDDEIEARAGSSVSEIFASLGEEAFRDLESVALLSLEGTQPAVVACGGGVVVRPANRAALKRMGKAVYLEVSAEEALARVGDAATRPLLAKGSGALAATALLRARESLYRSVADVSVDTAGLSAEEVARRVAALAKGLS